MQTKQLIPNPCSEISVIGDIPDQPLLIGACRRGRSTSYAVVKRQEHAALFDALAPLASETRRGYAVCAPIFGPNQALVCHRLPEALVNELRHLGLLIEAREAPRAVRFRCSLSSRPHKLLPRGRAASSPELGDWLVHPGLCLAGTSTLPKSCERSVAKFPSSPPAPTAWLRDVATRAMVPLWPTPRMLAFLQQLQPGQPPGKLRAGIMSTLKRMGVLVTRQHLLLQRRTWKLHAGQGRTHLAKQGYLMVSGLFGDAHIAALRQYYRELLEQGFMPYMNTGGNKRCFVTQNEPVAVFFQEQLTPLMQRATGKRLAPSFMSLAAYQGGAVLDKHVDGPTSDWNISLQIDFSPEPIGVAPWELCLQTTANQNTHVPVHLALGDGVIYRGNATPHFRPRLPVHMKSTTLIYHWRELG